jgi:hypothetical protein
MVASLPWPTDSGTIIFFGTATSVEKTPMGTSAVLKNSDKKIEAGEHFAWPCQRDGKTISGT